MISKLEQYKTNSTAPKDESTDEIMHVDLENLESKSIGQTIVEAVTNNVKPVGTTSAPRLNQFENVTQASVLEKKVAEQPKQVVTTQPAKSALASVPPQSFIDKVEAVKVGYDLTLNVTVGNSFLTVSYLHGVLHMIPNPEGSAENSIRLPDGVMPVIPDIMRFDLQKGVQVSAPRISIEWADVTTTPKALVDIIDSAFLHGGEHGELRRKVATNTPLIRLALALGYRGKQEPSSLIEHIIVSLIDAASSTSKYQDFSKRVSDVYSEQFRMAFAI